MEICLEDFDVISQRFSRIYDCFGNLLVAEDIDRDAYLDFVLKDHRDLNIMSLGIKNNMFEITLYISKEDLECE